VKTHGEKAMLDNLENTETYIGVQESEMTLQIKSNVNLEIMHS